MTNLDELRLKNGLCDRLMETELSINKARVLVDDLLQEYHINDEIMMGKKLQFEAPKVMAFLEIVLDYVISAHEDVKAIQERLSTQVTELRRACLENEEIKS